MARPWFSAPWDSHSDQPYRICDPKLRRRLRAACLGPHLYTAALTAATAPLVALRYASLHQVRFAGPQAASFHGLGCSPLPGLDQAQSELLDELDIDRVLVRQGAWQLKAWPRTRQFIAALAPRQVLLVLAQDRRSICQPGYWQQFCRQVIDELPDNVEAVQIGQAVNRLKWGCTHVGEALALDAVIPAIRQQRPALRILGSSIIDFEPLASLRSLLAWNQPRLDGVAALLYVDRRGDPANTQAGCFDLTRKIRAIAALTAISPRSAKRLWLTEFNWPLTGHGPWAPTSARECVSEDQAAAWLQRYSAMAQASGLVERIYWWQLLAQGYGLVDPRDLRRRPAFHALAARQREMRDSGPAES